MNNILRSALVIIGSLMTAFTAILAPTSAQVFGGTDSGIRIYCGQAADRSSNRTLPATLATTAGKEEPVVLVIWKSEAFKKFSPQQRCEMVSPKFQAAIQAGRYNIVSGQDPATGQGIICAVADKEETCNMSKMVFTLKSYKSADAVPEQLAYILNNKTSLPIYQSSGGKYVANLRDLFRRK